MEVEHCQTTVNVRHSMQCVINLEVLDAEDNVWDSRVMVSSPNTLSVVYKLLSFIQSLTSLVFVACDGLWWNYIYRWCTLGLDTAVFVVLALSMLYCSIQRIITKMCLDSFVSHLLQPLKTMWVQCWYFKALV